jgi:hypothetical protein
MSTVLSRELLCRWAPPCKDCSPTVPHSTFVQQHEWFGDLLLRRRLFPTKNRCEDRIKSVCDRIEISVRLAVRIILSALGTDDTGWSYT